MTVGAPMNGTRMRATGAYEHPPSVGLDRSHGQDLGLAAYVSASITFVAATTSQLQAANGTFPNAAFPVDSDIEVTGTNLNDGIYRITAIDATNQAYLTVDNPPKAEGPITAIVRSV